MKDDLRFSTSHAIRSEHRELRSELCFCRPALCPGLFQIPPHAVQYSVNELYRFRIGEFAGDFQSLIDDDCTWSGGKSKQFGDGGAHDVSVHCGHAFHAPMFGMTFDQAVNLRCTI